MTKNLAIKFWYFWFPGKILKLIDQKWEVIPQSDIHKLTNIEGQIWLALYQFIFNPETNRKYEMTNHSKERFAKVSWTIQFLSIEVNSIIFSLQQNNLLNLFEMECSETLTSHEQNLLVLPEFAAFYCSEIV